MTENEPPFLIDTNLLVYAQDKTADPHKHQMAKQFIAEQTLFENCFLSAQNLAEFYSVVTTKIEQPISASDAKLRLLHLAQTFQIIQYSKNTVLDAANTQGQHKIHFWDALIAATMLENSISVIYTENTRDFSRIPGITAINPLKNGFKKPKTV